MTRSLMNPCCSQTLDPAAHNVPYFKSSHCNAAEVTFATISSPSRVPKGRSVPQDASYLASAWISGKLIELPVSLAQALHNI